MNCTNNVEADVSLRAWSRYLPVLTPCCHGGIGIGVRGGGCIADGKALNPGGFDERFCESTRALVRAVLAACAARPELATTNRAALGALFGPLLQRGRREAAGSDPLRRAIGHDAVEATWRGAAATGPPGGEPVAAAG